MRKARMAKRSRGSVGSSGAHSAIDVAAVRTPLGDFGVAATTRGLAALFVLPRGAKPTPARVKRDPALSRRVRSGAPLVIHQEGSPFPSHLAYAVRTLREYASGKCSIPQLPLDWQGTRFQLAVWNELTRIPAGKTVSYGELAASIGHPGAARAVGGAVGANPVPILVPCHRVIGSDGSLTGFGLGLPLKRALLRHEGVPET